MGTEVIMFILTAFDRPAREYKWEQVFPVLESGDEADRPAMGGGQVVVAGGAPAQGAVAGAPVQHVAADGQAPAAMLESMASMADELARLRATTQALNEVSETLLASYKAITDNSAGISAASTGYVDQMKALDRNIAGLNTIYEIQLRSVSGQLDAIERVNSGIKRISEMYAKASDAGADYCEESEKMARYMQQLNNVYERMITAMTVNMYHAPMPGAPVPPASPATTQQQ